MWSFVLKVQCDVWRTRARRTIAAYSSKAELELNAVNRCDSLVLNDLPALPYRSGRQTPTAERILWAPSLHHRPWGKGRKGSLLIVACTWSLFLRIWSVKYTVHFFIKINGAKLQGKMASNKANVCKFFNSTVAFKMLHSTLLWWFFEHEQPWERAGVLPRLDINGSSWFSCGSRGLLWGRLTLPPPLLN